MFTWIEGTSYYQQPGASACLLGMMQGDWLANFVRRTVFVEQSQLVNTQVGETRVASFCMH